jgi:hypothetical protein
MLSTIAWANARIIDVKVNASVCLNVSARNGRSSQFGAASSRLPTSPPTSSPTPSPTNEPDNQ